MGLLKWIGGVVVLVVLSVFIGFQLLFDEAEIRQQLKSEAQKQGLTLEIDQPLRVSLFPSLQVGVEGVVLHANPEKGTPRVGLERLQLQLGWMPLLDKRLELEKIEATIDGANWNGSGSAQLVGNMQVARLKLHGDHLNVDRYLPAEAKGQAVDPVAGSAAGVTQLPVEPLRALDIQSEITLGKLEMAGATITDVAMEATVLQGKITVGPLNAKLYNGTYFSQMEADLSVEPAVLKLDEKLDGVALGALLQDMRGIDAFRGSLSAKGVLQAKGLDKQSLMRTLDGSAELQVNEGVLVGVNIQRLIRQGVALIEGKAPPQDNEPNETRFSDLKTSVTIHEGRMQSKELVMNMPFLTLTGAGWLELDTMQIDYRLNARVDEQIPEGVEALKKLAGKEFPVSIQGVLDDPKVKLELEEILKAGLQEKIRNKIGDKLNQFLKPQNESSEPGEEGGQQRSPEEQIKKQFGNILKGLF